jgi:hypothetical protein
MGVAAVGLLIAALIVTAGIDRDSDRVALLPGETHSAAELRAMQSRLRSQGLTAATVKDGTLWVPADEADSYRLAIGFGKESSPANQWSEVWTGASERLGRFASSRERQTAGEVARAEAVSRLLQELPDIASAEVVWDEGPSTGWRTPPKVRATVYLQAAEGKTIGPLVVDAVRRAVAGSKANLAPADVVVMDQTRMLTYDGPAATREQTRAAQLEAWHQSRIEAAVSHVPGARVTVFVSPETRTALASDDAANEPLEGQPASVTISIPEQAIRELAGFPRDTSSDSERHREIYRSVEEHLHRTLKEKAARLVPHGMTSEGLARIVVDTIPAPPSRSDAEPPAARAAFDLLSVVGGHPLLAVAVASGMAAIWMLLPLTRRVPQTSHSPNASQLESQTKVRPAMVPADQSFSSHVGAGAAETSAEDAAALPTGTSAARPPRSSVRGASHLEEALARLAQPKALLSTGEEPSSDASRAEASTTRRPPIAGANVLTALSSPEASRIPPPPESNVDGEIPSRSSAMRGDVEPRGDIEELTGVAPEVLRSLVSMLDVAVWSRALYGASVVLQAQILPHLPPEDARQVERHLQGRHPLRLREIDEAQRTVLAAWARVRQNLQQGGGLQDALAAI